MNTNKQIRRNITIALNIFIMAAFFTPCTLPGDAGTVQCDISSAFTEMKDTVKDIRETWEGIGRFVAGISNGIKAISGIIEPGALILLIAVLFLSAGFSAIGVPKGRAAFFTSLITIDVLWYLWEKSMHPGTFGFIYPMVKINLMVVLPYFLIVLFSRLVAIMIKRSFRKVSLKFKAFVRRGKDREEVVFLAERFRDSSRQVQGSLEHDISAGDGEKIAISGATRRRLDDLNRLVKEIED